MAQPITVASTEGRNNCDLKGHFYNLLPTHSGPNRVGFQWRVSNGSNEQTCGRATETGGPARKWGSSRIIYNKKKFLLEFQTWRAEQADMEDAWLFTVHNLWLRKVSENLAPWQQWKFLVSALVSKLCALLVPPSFSFPLLVLACPCGEWNIYTLLSQHNLISGNKLHCIRTKM